MINEPSDQDPMDVTKIPFNRLIAIRHSGDSEYVLELDGSEQYLNHLNAVHASAQFALAEATSGEYLLRMFEDLAGGVVPVVRKVDLKYRKPATGKIRSRAGIKATEIERVRRDIAHKGRATVIVKVAIYDSKGNLTMQSEFEWFVQKLNSG
jgi:acyl-coenzyme A thioesterase PaaI-like protein